MTLSCKHHLNVLGGGIENGRNLIGRHVDRFDISNAYDINGKFAKSTVDVENVCTLRKSMFDLA